MAGISCWMTWTIAPTPTPISSVASSALNAAAPMTVPAIAGSPAMTPRNASRPIVGRSLLRGATIARPSVVFWIAKPMIRNAPSARAPTA